MDKANEYQHEGNSTVGAGEAGPSNRTFLAQNSLSGFIPASFGVIYGETLIMTFVLKPNQWQYLSRVRMTNCKLNAYLNLRSNSTAGTYLKMLHGDAQSTKCVAKCNPEEVWSPNVTLHRSARSPNWAFHGDLDNTPHINKENRKMSKCSRLDLEKIRISTNCAQNSVTKPVPSAKQVVTKFNHT